MLGFVPIAAQSIAGPTAVLPPPGTLTSSVFKDNGAVLSNLSGLTVAVLSVPSLAMVKTFSSQSTNGSGVHVIADPLIVAGSKYIHVAVNADASVIGSEFITAT